MKLVFATHNPGKIYEMRALLAGLNLEVVSADEVGIHEEVVEDGKTFEANAKKKARTVAQLSGHWAVADDSGVCIAALGGAPGVHTARWAGEGAGDHDLVNHTLLKMKDVPSQNRGAYFESVIVLAAPDGRTWVFNGRVQGQIPLKPRGSARPKLPYDVIFIPYGENRTFAEMTSEEKNNLSHRGAAFRLFKEFLKKHPLPINDENHETAILGRTVAVISVLAYVLTMALESWRTGFVTYFWNPQILLILAIVGAMIGALGAPLKTRWWKNIVFFLTLAIVSGVVVWQSFSPSGSRILVTVAVVLLIAGLFFSKNKS